MIGTQTNTQQPYIIDCRWKTRGKCRRCSTWQTTSGQRSYARPRVAARRTTASSLCCAAVSRGTRWVSWGVSLAALMLSDPEASVNGTSEFRARSNKRPGWLTWMDGWMEPNSNNHFSAPQHLLTRTYNSDLSLAAVLRCANAVRTKQTISVSKVLL